MLQHPLYLRPLTFRLDSRFHHNTTSQQVKVPRQPSQTKQAHTGRGQHKALGPFNSFNAKFSGTYRAPGHSRANRTHSGTPTGRHRHSNTCKTPENHTGAKAGLSHNNHHPRCSLYSRQHNSRQLLPARATFKHTNPYTHTLVTLSPPYKAVDPAATHSRTFIL